MKDQGYTYTDIEDVTQIYRGTISKQITCFEENNDVLLYNKKKYINLLLNEFFPSIPDAKYRKSNWRFFLENAPRHKANMESLDNLTLEQINNYIGHLQNQADKVIVKKGQFIS
ncbi:hypothetical protein ABPG74_019093 [Tetrahymena malaccensis]